LRKLSGSGEQHCNGQRTSTVCYNGGTCSSTNDSQSPCECPEGTGGLYCEKPCTLHCENGGQCSFEADSDGVGEPATQWGQSEDGMFCRCKRGFVGLHCELEAESCGPSDIICLAGSTCIQDNLTKAYRCRQPRVSRCNPSSGHAEFYDGMAVAAFCLNDGICREVTIGNEL